MIIDQSFFTPAAVLEVHAGEVRWIVRHPGHEPVLQQAWHSRVIEGGAPPEWRSEWHDVPTVMS